MERGRWTLFVIGAVLACASCFETPVEERIEIVFEGTDRVTLVTTVVLDQAMATKGKVGERLLRLERELVEETDAWTRRSEPLEAPGDVLTLERERGRLVRARRELRLASRDAVPSYFTPDALSVRYDERVGDAEFSIVPQGSGPATMQERRRVQSEMAAWADRAAPYFEAVTALWRHLDDRPERALACLAALFGDDADATGLDDEERALVNDVEEAAGGVLDLFEIPGDESEPLDERVRRVYDPFPAPLSVRVPGEIVEVEGFKVTGDGAYEIPALGLWNAFRSLEGRWIAPDPLVATWIHERRKTGEDFDVEGFAARPRFVRDAPSAGEVARAIEDALRPAPIYRVRWRFVPAAGSAETGTTAASGPGSGSPE